MPNPIDTMQAEIAELEKTMAAEPGGEQPAQEPEPEPEPEPQRKAAEKPEKPEKEPQQETPEYERNLSRALREERDARREAQKVAEERQREYDRNLAILNDRLERMQQAFSERQQPQPEPEPELPEHIRKGAPTVSWEDDPTAYFKQRDEIDQHRDRQVRELLDGQKRHTETSERQRQLGMAIQGAEYQFAQQHPDYYDAVAHLRRDRVGELMDIGLTYEQAMHRANAEELQIAQHALSIRKNPAEVAYKLAQRRGYKGQGAGNGAADAAAPTTPAPETPAARPTPEHPETPAQQSGQDIERLAAGQREAQTLGAVSGGTGGKLTPETLVKMSEADFSAWLAKATPQQQREMLGG